MLLLTDQFVPNSSLQKGSAGPKKSESKQLSPGNKHSGE